MPHKCWTVWCPRMMAQKTGVCLTTQVDSEPVTLEKAAGDSKQGSLRWLEETYPGGQQCALSPTTTPWKKCFTRISWLAVRSHSKLKLAKLAW